MNSMKSIWSVIFLFFVTAFALRGDTQMQEQTTVEPSVSSTAIEEIGGAVNNNTTICGDNVIEEVPEKTEPTPALAAATVETLETEKEKEKEEITTETPIIVESEDEEKSAVSDLDYQKVFETEKLIDSDEEVWVTHKCARNLRSIQGDINRYRENGSVVKATSTPVYSMDGDAVFIYISVYIEVDGKKYLDTDVLNQEDGYYIDNKTGTFEKEGDE